MGRDPVMLRKTQPLCFPLGQPPAALPVQNPAPNPTTMKLPRILTTLLPALGASVQLVAQSTPAPQPTQEEPLVLSAFSVTTQQDRGYRAGNSVPATRI